MMHKHNVFGGKLNVSRNGFSMVSPSFSGAWRADVGASDRCFLSLSGALRWFQQRQTSKFFTLFNHLLIFLAHPPHLYNTQASMLRQPGTQIKCVGYRTLEPVISTRSLMCLCRLTNVSIVRMKKGGKRFEVSFAVQELKTSLISQ